MDTSVGHLPLPVGQKPVGLNQKGKGTSFQSVEGILDNPDEVLGVLFEEASL